MKTTLFIALALLVIVGSWSLNVGHAQQSGVKRTDLQTHDLSVSGREVVQVRVDIAPGVVAPAHKHPGERDHFEIIKYHC